MDCNLLHWDLYGSLMLELKNAKKTPKHLQKAEITLVGVTSAKATYDERTAQWVFDKVKDIQYQVIDWKEIQDTKKNNGLK